jgi:NADH-quinone oxidoreductase subunit G
MIIIGQGAISGANGASVLAAAAKLAGAVGAVTADWNGFAVLHTAASRVGGLDLGFVPGEGGKTAAEMLASTDVLFLLGADEIDFSGKTGGFTVYIGSHGDEGAHGADVILPGATYTEKSGTLGQHRRPRPDGQPRRLRTGRRPRRLGDHSRALRRARQEAAV